MAQDTPSASNGQPSLSPGTSAASEVETTSQTPPNPDIMMHWQLARAHLDERAPRAALPHLERLVSLAPDNPRFRMELGRALFLIEDDGRARHHFEYALAGELSLTEIAAVNEYLRAMEGRKSWQGHSRIAAVRHSNPFHRSGDEYVNIGGKLLLPLPAVESANGVEIGLGGTYLPRIAPDLHARLHLMATGQFFENEALNRWHLRAELGLLALGDHAQQIGGGLLLQGAFDRQGEIMRGIGLYAGIQRRLSNRTLVSFRATAERLTYANAPALDGPRYTAQLEGSRVLSPRMMAQGGLSLSHHHTKSGFNRRSIGSLSLGGQYAFSGGFQTGLETQLERTHVAEPNPLLFQHGAERTTRMSVSTRLMHRDFSVKGFAPILIVRYTTQSSNLPTQTYNDIKVSLGATRNF